MKIRTCSSLVALLLACAAACGGESLYDPATYRSLVTDRRAYREGDVLTLLIFESATATTSANNSINRKSKISASAANLEDAVGGSLSTDNQFDGGGVEKRSGEVVARVSVAVTGVLANGDLQVKGEQMIELNNESQRISVAGRVRPDDIASDNSVLSTRLADARIEFKGHGLLSSKERPGLITRFFHWLF